MTQKTFLTRKLKDCLPPEKKDCCSNELLEKFYDSTLEKPVKNKTTNLVWLLVLTVFFSFLTSLTVFFLFLSGAFYESKISQWLGFQPLTPNNIIVEKKETYNIAEEEYLTNLLQEITPTTVGIFLEDTKSKIAYYQNKNFVGSGMIMTSDGWIVTAKNLLDRQNNYVVIDQSGKIYKILEIKSDETWNIAYLKIEANNLPVITLANYKSVNQGDKVVLVAGIGALNKESIISRISNTNLILTNSYPWLTEENYLHFALESKNIGSNFMGSPVVNYKKEIVGILLKNGSTEYILPADYLKKHFNMLLTLKKYSPAYLGLEYIDLSVNINSQNSKGALVLSVANNSPLFKTAIKKGTVILKVGDDLINANNNFSNLIQEYRAGDKINLTYLDNDPKSSGEKTLDVELR